MVYSLIRLTFLFFISAAYFKAESQVMGSSRKKTKQEKQHLEIVSKFHSERGYIKKFIESGLMSGDIEWFVPGPKNILPFAGLWKGAEGIEEFNHLLDATMRYDKVEIKEYIVDGEQVAAIFWAEGIAKSTGKVFKSEILRLYTFKNGKIIKVRNYYDTASYVSAVTN